MYRALKVEAIEEDCVDDCVYESTLLERIADWFKQSNKIDAGLRPKSIYKHCLSNRDNLRYSSEFADGLSHSSPCTIEVYCSRSSRHTLRGGCANTKIRMLEGGSVIY